MKNKFLLVSFLPFLLTACSPRGAGFAAVKERVDGIAQSDLHPYYRVKGTLDYNNTLLTVDEDFINQPEPDKFVPYSRFNEGFYCTRAESYSEEEDDKILIYAMASRSYWLRVPLKIDSTNFYQLDNGVENSTCAHYNLSRLITSWMDSDGSANPSTCYVYYELLSDGGFAIGGDKVHTTVMIDNYPFYPDPSKESQAQPWKANNPRPMYKNSAEGKFNIRFEYDANGWLKREYLASIDYDFDKSVATQVALESFYYYRNGNSTW